MATMKPIASSLSTTLLLAVAVLGSTTVAVDAASKPWSQDAKTTTTTTTTTTVEATGSISSKDSNDVKGYLLFRQDSDCNDNDGDHYIRSSTRSGHTEYNGNGHDGDGYLPYPGGNRNRRNRNRRRALRALTFDDENAVDENNEQQQQHQLVDVRNLEEGKNKCSKSSKKGSAVGPTTKSSKGSKSGSKADIYKAQSKSSKKSAWSIGSDFPGWYDDPNYSPSSSTYVFPSPSTTPGTPTNVGVDEWADSTHDGSGGSDGYGTYPTSPNNYTPNTSPTSPTSIGITINTTPSPTKANLAGPKSTEIATVTTKSNCDALTNDNEVVRTLHFARLRYTYEAMIDEDTTIESVLTGLEGRLSKFVGRDLMECDDDDDGKDDGGNENNDQRRRRVQSTMEIRQHQENSLLENRRRRLEGWEIVGVDPSLPLDKLSETKSCTYFTDGTSADTEENCYVIEGGMTLYTSVVDDNEGTTGGNNGISSNNNDNNPWENTLRSVLEERTKYALILIMDAMNDDDDNEDRRSPFLQDHGGYHSVPGLKDVRFLTGLTQDGEEIDASSISDDDNNNGGPSLAKASVRSSNNLDTVGYSLMGVGLTALVALSIAFVIILQKRRRDGDGKNESYNKFDDDGDWEEADDDDDDRKTELVSVVSSHDDLSLSVSSPTSRNSVESSSPVRQGSKRTTTTTPITYGERTGKKSAYVVGEDGSEYTNGNNSTLSYDVSQYLHNNAHSHSSSFESENGNDYDDDDDYERQVDVHFVSAMEDDEVGIQSTISSTRTRRKSSYRKKKKKVPSSPKFDNPADIERPYVVDNTVDF